MNILFRVYEAQQNTDRIDGKGSMKTFAYFTTENLAVKAVQNKGVMGVGTGDVVEVTYEEDPSSTDLDVRRDRIWGYRKSWNGTWGYGWVDNRDAPEDDPEYAEYLRLKSKFGA